MTPKQQFIEDAIKGGYESTYYYYGQTVEDVVKEPSMYVHYILLQPQAWQAVGKTRGWKSSHSREDIREIWQFKMMWFVGYLSDGLSIDEALSATT